MSKCCSVPHIGAPPICPMSGVLTKSVSRKTLESLLKPEAKKALTVQPYYFCESPDCDAVYISALGDHLITKDQLTIRVGIKETEDPIPLCYCFNYDRSHVRNEIKTKGSTDIPKIISQRVKAGECRCEETNPSGGCCLGNVYRAIKQAEILKKKEEL